MSGVDNCINQSDIEMLTRNSFGMRLFTLYGFSDVIKNTLNNDIVIKDIRKNSDVKGRQVQDNIFTNVLYTQWLRAYMSTRAMYDRLSSIRDQYLVKAMLQTIMEDALAENPETGNVFTAKIKKDHEKSRKIQQEIDNFEDQFKINRIISSSGIMEDAIFYGEYTMEQRLQKGKGITHLIDANPPGTVFGVYNNVVPEYFVRMKKKIRSFADQLEAIPPYDIWHITIFPRKIKFSISEQGISNQYLLNNSVINEISHYFRIGEPLCLSTYNKILELEAFEQLQLAKDFGDAKRRNIAGVSAPAGKDLDQLKIFTQYYEEILNESGNGMSNPEELNGLQSVNGVISSLANIRVVPIQPDRGAIEMLNTQANQGGMQNTMENIEDRRKIICDATGVPYAYIFTGRDGGKLDIKQYARYIKFLKRVQSGLAESLQRLYAYDLTNKGYTVDPSDIEINFYNTINISELDKLEYNDAAISLMQNFDSFVQGLSSNPDTAEYMDIRALMKFYKKTFKTMEGAADIIVVPEKNMNGKPDTPTPDKTPEVDKEETKAVDENYFNEEFYPMSQVHNWLKTYFRNQPEEKYKYWINHATSRFPEVPEQILIDTKNDVLSKMEMYHKV